jgi:soluble lytic murein transglycosylase-like protein
MPLDEPDFLESILENRFKGSKTRMADSIQRGYAKDPDAGLKFLSDMFEYQIKDNMETVFEKSMEIVPPPRKEVSKEERARMQQEQMYANAKTPQEAQAATKSYKAIRGEGKVKDEKAPEEIARRVEPALQEIKLDAGWSDGKAAAVKSTVVNVETNPILTNEPPMVKAIAAVESGGNPNAISQTNVKGLMQVTGDTARSLNERYGTNHDLTTPEGSLALSKLLLDELFRKKLYRGNRQLVYAAYNAGEPALDLAIRLADGSTDWREVRLHLYDALKALHASGQYKVNPRKKAEETRAYPDKVLQYEELFSQLA